MNRKIMIITIIIAMLTVISSFAQMGGGMKGGGMMSGDQGHMGGMLKGHDMMGGIKQNMNQMMGVVRQMTDMMGETTDPARMRKMGDIMGHMSEQMKDMSRIMSKGEVSQREMEELHQQTMENQKRFEMMKRW